MLPFRSGIIAWELNRWYGYDSAGEFSLDRMGNHNARLVNSYCAEGDGFNDYVDYGGTDFVDTTQALRASFFFSEKAGEDSGTVFFGQESSGNRGFFVGLVGEDGVGSGRGVRIQIGYGPSDPSSRHSLDFYDHPITPDTWYHIDVTITGDSVEDELTVTVNYNYGDSIETQTISGQDMLYGMGNELEIFRAFNSNTSCFNGSIANFKFWISNIEDSDTPVIHHPFAGSCIDISGNGNHGENNGVDLISDTQDEYHYNVLNGFRLYEHATEPDLYVPIYDVDGNEISITAGTDIPAGYSLASTHPAGYWHNGAETELIVGATTYDGTGWNVDAKVKTADTEEHLHDAATGYGIPLGYDDLQAVFLGDYLFCDVTEENKYKNLLLYREAPTYALSIAVNRYVGNTLFLTDENGVYLYDEDGHIITV